MGDYTTFPEEAYNDNSVFVEHARNIGRAYRNRALKLINMCQFLSRITPLELVHEDAELRGVLRVCDLALRSAAESGKKENDEANKCFEEATQVLGSYSERLNGSRVNVSTRMERAKRRDKLQKGRSLAKHENNRICINFVILPSPALVALNDPKTIIVRQVLSARPSLPEILWNFSRYHKRARVTLEQNPHFYSDLPTDESAYTPMFKCQPLGDFSKSLKPHDTVYVLVGRPSRVFLETVQEKRCFGNIWMLNGSLIFKDSTGVLEGEQLIRTFSARGSLKFCERPVVLSKSESRGRVNHSCLRPVITSSTDLTFGSPFKDWTVLSRPESCSNSNIHIYDTQWASGSSKYLDPFPLPPTTGRPGYQVLYTSTETLNDDILLSVFNYYQLHDEENWNSRLGWCKLSHVCRRWRHLIRESVFHLNSHILCTNGTPVVDMLAHFPLMPLVIDYHCATTTLGGLGSGIFHALLLRDRVRRVVIHIPSSVLDVLLVLMDEIFPILEHLSISSTPGGTGSALPGTFLAPDLRHLALSGISLPGELTLLSTVSLVTLAVTNIQASSYFLPKYLLTHLQSLSQLEELSIGFSDPLPRPSAEMELLDALETPVTLLTLRRLTFRGVSVYLESLVAQMRAPLLEQFDISLFYQVAFALPRLSEFTDATPGLKHPVANVIFKHDAVFVVMDQHRTQQLDDRPPNFSLRIICKHFDWQIDSAAQICESLMPALSAAERLTLNFDGERLPAEWQGGAVDGTTWRELLGPFIGATELHICHALTWELSSALQLDDVGLDPGLLPSLHSLVLDVEKEQAVNAFASFINTCQVAGRPVRLWPRARNPRPCPSFPEPIPVAPFIIVDGLGKRMETLEALIELANGSAIYHSRAPLWP